MFKRFITTTTIVALCAAAALGLADHPASAAGRGDDGRNEVQTTSSSYATMGDFLTAVLVDVDTYWTDVLESSGHRTPFVRYVWPGRGETYTDACSRKPSTDRSAFYCSADDTIVISQQFAFRVWEGALDSWSSGDRPTGPLGDMAVAFIVAHEYAHNVEQELGIYGRGLPSKATELAADCMAGSWAAAMELSGRLDPGDFDEAVALAWLFGDYGFSDTRNHHGTPAERVAAFSTGFDAASPDACNRFLRR